MAFIRSIVILLSIAELAVAYDHFDTTDTPFLSFSFAGYRGINYQSTDSSGHEVYGWIIFRCGKMLVSSIKWPTDVTIFRYPEYYGRSDNSGTARPIYDINGDGKGEIILQTRLTPTIRIGSTFIYSLDTAATEIGKFDGLKTGLGPVALLNIDDDQYPELVFNDVSHAGLCLVWKWDGTRYRIANAKLHTEILRIIYHTDSTEIANKITERRNGENKIKDFDPNKMNRFQQELMHNMVMLISLGRPEEARQLLNASWKGGDPTKVTFEQEIWDLIKSSHYWNGIKESNW